MPVKTTEKGWISRDELACQFFWILKEAPPPGAAPPVGIMTSDRRDTWAAAREDLLKSNYRIILITTFYKTLLTKNRVRSQLQFTQSKL